MSECGSDYDIDMAIGNDIWT